MSYSIICAIPHKIASLFPPWRFVSPAPLSSDR